MLFLMFMVKSNLLCDTLKSFQSFIGTRSGCKEKCPVPLLSKDLSVLSWVLYSTLHHSVFCLPSKRIENKCHRKIIALEPHIWAWR